jgi:hypothetical protein
MRAEVSVSGQRTGRKESTVLRVRLWRKVWYSGESGERERGRWTGPTEVTKAVMVVECVSVRYFSAMALAATRPGKVSVSSWRG